jgi:ubiquinone/menaquinone biosynthesis C-methylase UbiE
MSDVEKQREFYRQQAHCYDEMCASDKCDEHYVASAVLCGLLDLYKVKSLLDLGCGTGRSLAYVREHSPQTILSGVEPVEALRQQCLEKGFSPDQIQNGDACRLCHADGSVDCVSMFGVLHHIPKPELAIQEAMRVAAKMVVISDHNIYGMGSAGTRFFKQTFRAIGLRKVLGLIMTRGKGYHDTDWDGVFYPFSLIDHYDQIRSQVAQMFCFSTKTPAVNLLRNASHVAIVGIKQEPGVPVGNQKTGHE